MASGVFAASISCMDGRIQTALSDWIRNTYGVDYVDTITAPGVDKRVAEESDVEPIVNMARISIQKHGSRLVVLSGHHDCAGNPVSREDHISHIKSGVDNIRSWVAKHDLMGAAEGSDQIEVVGVWVGEEWTAQRIA